jgi:hypothetical protein
MRREDRSFSICARLSLTALFCLAFCTAGFAGTFTVSSTADSGAGTLRQAILDANANPGPDTITFSVAAFSVITPATPLPQITDTVNIGSGARVELNGSAAGPFGIGLRISAPDCVVSGMAINQWQEAGIRIDGLANNTTLEGGLHIGVDFAGNVAKGNVNRGVLIVGTTGNVIRSAGLRNTISGNIGRGIEVTAGGAVTISGTNIGTNAAGTGDLGNTSHGIQIVNSSNSVIGDLVIGNEAATRNVISGNNGSGIFIIGDVGTPANNNVVRGNFIGVDIGGNTALGNSGSGITIADSGNTVGGAAGASTRNVIAGNSVDGISISSSLAAGNAIRGNYIGVGANATTAIPNTNNGIRFSSLAANNLVGDTDVTPGLCNMSCNLIANNGSATATSARAGVYVESTAGVGNQIVGNSIFSNGAVTGIGIDLAAPGATANDTGDADTGPNNIQNKPVITQATDAEFIAGTLSSVASTPFRIDFYRNDSGDGAASEGRLYIGYVLTTTNASGVATFTYSTPAPLTAGQFITATATRGVASFGSGPLDTSEFSDPQAVIANPSAANVQVSGRVATESGIGIRGVIVTLSGSDGVARRAMTNAFGYYAFSSVEAGQTYTVTATHRRYQFAPRVLTVNDGIDDLNFTPAPE